VTAPKRAWPRTLERASRASLRRFAHSWYGRPLCVRGALRRRRRDWPATATLDSAAHTCLWLCGTHNQAHNQHGLARGHTEGSLPQRIHPHAAEAASAACGARTADWYTPGARNPSRLSARRPLLPSTRLPNRPNPPRSSCQALRGLQLTPSPSASVRPAHPRPPFVRHGRPGGAPSRPGQRRRVGHVGGAVLRRAADRPARPVAHGLRGRRARGPLGRPGVAGRTALGAAPSARHCAQPYTASRPPVTLRRRVAYRRIPAAYTPTQHPHTHTHTHTHTHIHTHTHNTHTHTHTPTAHLPPHPPIRPALPPVPTARAPRPARSPRGCCWAAGWVWCCQRASAPGGRARRRQGLKGGRCRTGRPAWRWRAASWA
jgi:hypothetical protein